MIDDITGKLIESIHNKPELSNLFQPILDTLERIKVAKLEMDALEKEYYRGDLTDDTYLTRRKKLRTDLVSSQNKLRLEMLEPVINKIEEKETKSRFQKMKEAIISNKDLFVFIGQLALSFLNKA